MRDSEPGDHDALEEAAESRLAKLRTRPELNALLEEIKRDLDHGEGSPEALARVPAQRVAVATAKAALKHAQRPLDEVAEDAGIALDEFKKLDAASPTARTQIALRVLDQIDAIYRDKTLGGTGRLPRPEAIMASEGEHAATEPSEPPTSGQAPSSRAPTSAPSSRNITGTARLPVPPEVKKNITGTERIETPSEVRAHPRNVTGTERLPIPDEVQARLAEPAVLPSPLWLAAVVAILVAVVLLAVFR